MQDTSKKMSKKRLGIIAGAIILIAIVLGASYYLFFMPPAIPTDLQAIMNQLPRYYPDDFATVIEAARKEGSVNFYSSMLPADMGGILAAQVQKLYGITVNVYSAGAETVLTKLLAEREAGNHACDVLALADMLAMDNLSRQGLIADYRAIEGSNFGSKYADPNYRLYTYTGFAAGWAYNTALVNQSDLPRSYADILNSRWTGKVVMGDPEKSGSTLRWLMSIVQPSMSSEIGWTFVQNMLAQTQPLVVTSSTSSYNTVVSGERVIGLCTSDNVVTGLAQGKPVLYIPGLNQTSSASVAGILIDAPHPNAAKLVLEYLLSEDFATRGLIPYSWYSFRTEAPPPFGLQPFSEVEKTLIPLNATWASANRAAVVQQWKSLRG